MDYLITFTLAFGGAWLAFALQRNALVDAMRASRLEAERRAMRFREDHAWVVVIAAEIDDLLGAHPGRSNVAILESLRASARSGARFTLDQVGVLRPSDVGRARQWHAPGSADDLPERYFYRHVEKTLEQAAARLERHPELARCVAEAPLVAARECGLLAPPDAGPALDASEHVRRIAEKEQRDDRSAGERHGAARARRVHATVHVLRSVVAGAKNARAEPARVVGDGDDQDE